MMTDLRPTTDVRLAAATPVLVADHDARRRGSLSAIVRQHDPAAVIIESAFGEELTHSILTCRPALGFVNMEVSGLGGPEAVALARKGGGRFSCLVLITSRILPRWQEVAQALEAYEVLRTPLDPDHIGSLLRANARRLTPTSVLLAANPHAGRLVRRVLTQSGFNVAVDEAEEGRHALKLLSRSAYEIAFVDTALSGMDGLELACQVQSLRLPTRLVLMTPGDPERIVHAARYFGAAFILRMPFYPRDIDLLLHHALGLRRPYLLHALTAPPAPTALVPIAAVPAVVAP